MTTLHQEFKNHYYFFANVHYATMDFLKSMEKSCVSVKNKRKWTEGEEIFSIQCVVEGEGENLTI